MSLPSRRDVLRRLGTLGVVPAATAGVTARSGAGNASGSVAWQRTYGDEEFQFDALVETDDGVLVVGRTGSSRSAAPWLAEVGADGEPRWRTTVDVPGFAAAVDAVPADGGYAVVGRTDERPQQWLLRVDGDGHEQWRRREGHPGHHGVQALQSTDDGYLLAGYLGNPRRTDADLTARVEATDADGRRRWVRTYDASYVTDVVPWNDGFVLAGGADDDAWVQSVAADGTPGWRHTYGGVDSEDAGPVVPAGDGLLYGGATGSPPDAVRRGMLVRSTADGGFAWRRTYDLQGVAALTPHGDGFAFTGEPTTADRGAGRDPDKPVHVADRWGRVRETVTVTVPVGEPGGLARFDDGTLVVGGWSGEEGIWLAKLDP